MKEFKVPEIEEIKKPEPEKFKDIKPEKDTTVKECGDFWNNEFKKDIKEVASEYLDDLRSKSDCPETIKDDVVDVNSLERQSPETVAENRREFDNMKSDLRAQWEKDNGKEWPKYDDFVYNKNGIPIRKPGDNYDAHHITPLCLGGKNEASNITPLHLDAHKEVHSQNGSGTKLDNAIGGS